MEFYKNKNQHLIYFEKCGKVSNGRKILPANVISGLYPQIMLQNKPGMLEVQFRGFKDIFMSGAFVLFAGILRLIL